MSFLKSCGCKLCNKIDKAIAQKVLGADASEIATHIVGIMHSEPDNIQHHCVECHAEMDEGRAKRREALGVAALCPSCAETNTEEYVGAFVDGEMVKTNNPRSAEAIRRYHKGTHAIQG